MKICNLPFNCYPSYLRRASQSITRALHNYDPDPFGNLGEIFKVNEWQQKKMGQSGSYKVSSSPRSALSQCCSLYIAASQTSWLLSLAASSLRGATMKRLRSADAEPLFMALFGTCLTWERRVIVCLSLCYWDKKNQSSPRGKSWSSTQCHCNFIREHVFERWLKKEQQMCHGTCVVWNLHF